MQSQDKPKILFFDIESAPVKAWVWNCGKQYVGHKQLVKEHNQYGIICIAYAWNDDKPAKVLDWGYDEQDTGRLVKEFDEIIQQADHVIGKNSDRFDNKMINAARMFAGLPGIPSWTKYTDDLEKQMRKHFRMPSQSLDYISNQLGYGGKIRMEFQDWIDIVEKTPEGPKAFKKMLKYNKKDVEDTRSLWYYLSSHFEPKFSMANYMNDRICCRHEDCGSRNVKKNGIRWSGQVRYQEYFCNNCGRYAGRTSLAVSGREGRIG
jgi:hypothetical protein